MPKGIAAATASMSSVGRIKVSAPPIAISEVDAKNAVPFCSDAMIWVSTMRTSRSSMRVIQISR